MSELKEIKYVINTGSSHRLRNNVPKFGDSISEDQFFLIVRLSSLLEIDSDCSEQSLSFKSMIPKIKDIFISYSKYK